MWFRSIPVENFLSLVGDFSGLNVCFDKEVQGQLSVKTEGSKPWPEVIEGVLGQHGYEVRINSQHIYVYRP